VIDPATDTYDVLDACRQEAWLSHSEPWLRYFEIGGMSTGFELEADLPGALVPSRYDHDVIAYALNERFSELGTDHPVGYVTGRNREDRRTRRDFHGCSG
jgi:hypothetical protein